MASLSSGVRLGTGSTSALLKSSNTIQTELATYQDTVAKIEYENSAKTDADFQQYATYLQGRVDALNATGSVTSATKALNMQQEITSAQKSNVSANIQRENIQIMAGNASLSDKYNVIVDQFQRAISIGDNALAQSLESQAYSVSQSIQYQAQEAGTAAKALSTAQATTQGEIKTSLDNSLKQLNTDIQHVGEKGAESVVKQWVNVNSSTLASLGVVIPAGSQPNYFDLVKGIVGAQYNALVLKAQVQSAYDPIAAQNTLSQAQALQTGQTKIETLGGSITYQELTQAAQDPSMFSFDYASGKYIKTQQTGYQYVNGQVAPTFSGTANKTEFDKTFYLNPAQTKEMSGLGLTFSQNKSGTTGDGVYVQASQNSPAWLQNVLGGHGETQMYTDSTGNLQFVGSSSDGLSRSYYTLVGVNGLQGLYEHLPDGNTNLVGGDYGFNAGAAQLLVNMSQNTQHQIALEQAAVQASQAAIRLAAPKPLPSISLAPPPPVTQPTATATIQPAAQTKSVQGAAGVPQASSSSAKAIQGAAGNIQSGGSGIKITGTTNAPVGIRL